MYRRDRHITLYRYTLCNCRHVWIRRYSSTTMSFVLQAIESLPWGTKVIGGTALTGAVVLILLRRINHKNSKHRGIVSDDTVILHQIGRAPHVPSLTPFAVKLESYLRLAGVKYQSIHGQEKGPKGKWPWIEYQGQATADSEFCIERINKAQGIDLNCHLSPEQKGVGRAVQRMVEENTYWTLLLDRWVYDPTEGVYNMLKLPWFIRWRVRSYMKNMAYNQGVGRHTKEEVLQILRTDLQALSDVIGEKRFLMGPRPCQHDCAVFGILAEMLWEPFGGFTHAILCEFPILTRYCESMKKDVWPDWDECTSTWKSSSPKS